MLPRCDFAYGVNHNDTPAVSHRGPTSPPPMIAVDARGSAAPLIDDRARNSAQLYKVSQTSWWPPLISFLFFDFSRGAV